ncbi:MAG TPA: hypothetical protein VFN11_14035 [Ktedonobacterales bacterium]|nr:hypothetical protein [Ktedonobacterales bacterium]
MRRTLAATLSVVAVLAVVLSVAVGLVGRVRGVSAQASNHAQVTANVHHDVSPPLRDIRSKPLLPTIHGDRPLRLLPSGPGGANPQPPGALQTTTGPLVGTTSGLSFDGIGDTSNTPSNPCNCAPPDTNGAVGATQYVQWVNTAFAVYNKSTGVVAAGFPKAGNVLWSGFGGGCQTNNDGDPVAQYDKIAQRWVMTQFSVSTTPYLQCVAVSQTSDATGAYNRYSFSYGTTQFNDYPKLGVWPDGYYTTYNIFNNGSTFAGAKLCAFDRASMLTGAAATQQCFQLSTSFGGVLPSDLDGATTTLGAGGSGLPPAGTPNLMMNFGSNSLNLWKFHVDWATPANTTLTGPINIPVANFSAACNGGGSCIPQPGTSNKLDSLADRLMYRLSYRHFADGHESLLVNHSVFVSGSRKSQVTGVRWYELRNPSGGTMASGTPVVFQQGTFSPDSTSRWMGSIAQDKLGDLALGYSASSSSVFPSIRYTGRLTTDALGTMEAENSILSGPASQTGTLHRWGDYSAMTVDPVDDCTFWYTSEYIPSTGSFNWSTHIASFKFSGCA